MACLDWGQPETPTAPEPYNPRDAAIGIVYFIGPEVGPVKIGYTTNLPSRLKRLQSGSPVRLSVLAAALEQEMIQERIYHFRFAEHRLHGEWFARCPEIEAEIARLTSPPTKGTPHDPE